MIQEVLEYINGEGGAGFTQSEGNAEAVFFLAVIVADEVGGTNVPSASIAENGILLDRHGAFRTIDIPIERSGIFFVDTQVGLDANLLGIALNGVIVDIAIAEIGFQPRRGHVAYAQAIELEPITISKGWRLGIQINGEAVRGVKRNGGVYVGESCFRVGIIHIVVNEGVPVNESNTFSIGVGINDVLNTQTPDRPRAPTVDTGKAA